MWNVGVRGGMHTEFLVAQRSRKRPHASRRSSTWGNNVATNLVEI